MNNRAVWIIPVVTCLLGAIAGGVVTNFVKQAEEQRLKTQAELNKRTAFYEKMDLHLDGSYMAFNNQKVARDRLFKLLEQNHAPLPEREYEPLFRKLYPLMNEDEKVLFELIRGITTTSLHKHNDEMLKLLEKNPKYRNELREFKALQDHLDLWLSKYKATVEKREDVCLVYTGVSEEKPFPNGINEKVRQILNQIQTVPR